MVSSCPSHWYLILDPCQPLRCWLELLVTMSGHWVCLLIKPVVVHYCVCQSVCLKTCRHIARCMMNGDLLKLCISCRVPWCQQCVKFWWWPSDPIKFKKSFIVLFTLFYGPLCSIAVTRSQFLRRLLCGHAQTAAVWKTVAVNLDKPRGCPKSSSTSRARK